MDEGMNGIGAGLIFTIAVVGACPGINKGPQVEAGGIPKMQARRRSVRQVAVLGGGYYAYCSGGYNYPYPPYGYNYPYQRYGYGCY